MASLGHPCKIQRLSRLGSVTARHSISGRQLNFAALNRKRHLYSARRPSRSALAHILVLSCFFFLSFLFPHLISAVADWVSTILPHMWGLSVNLKCRSEMCCKRLAANAGPKKVAKNRHLVWSCYLRSPYVIGGAIIFLPCSFYLLSSSFFFSSPNLSGRRLDVYHTSTHGVALVRI